MNGSRKAGLVLGAVIMASGAWAYATRVEPVSDLEAREFVAELAQIAQSGDVHGLCEHSVLKGSCEILVEDIGDLVPTEAPQVVCTWPLSGSDHRVAALSGVDGAGKDYVNYLAVVRDGSKLRGSPTVFWVDHVIEDLDLAFGDDAIACR